MLRNHRLNGGLERFCKQFFLKGYRGIGLTFLLLLSLGLNLQAQDEVPKASNGWHMYPQGRLHILMVFVELDYDSTFGHLDPLKGKDDWQWRKGKLPIWKDEIISHDPIGNGFMTKYFRQASFGRFQVTGDYVEDILTIPISTIRNRNGKVVTREPYGSRAYKGAVMKALNAMERIPFKHNSSFDDFDYWGLTGPGMPKSNKPNKKIDMVMLIFRNIHVVGLGNHSGFVNYSSVGLIKGKGSDMYSMFRTSDAIPKTIMRHEFSHMLYGGNNFHTANGGAGTRNFMATVGGWSNMSASDACSPVYNGWDRERMGWKPAGNRYLLSARCGNLNREAPGELIYGEENCDGDVYILRDFVTTGDVIKIPLPHLPDSVKNQYLWLENHQRKPGILDHRLSLPKGLYAYYQVGKDTKAGAGIFGEEGNYIWPLCGIGNYDFRFDLEPRMTMMFLDDERANPFTGYHYLMRQSYDLDGDGKIRLTTDYRPKSEYILAGDLKINGVAPPDEYFSYMRYPIFGNKDVPFRHDKWNKIGISHNPAATPIYTYRSPGGPAKYDNRRIYLNGISIEVLRQDEQGNLYLKIRWDDFDIVKDVRWCGDILSKEEINIRPNVTLELDQGYSPQVPTKVQDLNGEAVFARPTVLELAPGSVTRVARGGKLLVRKGSSLVVKRGARLDIENRGEVIIEPGAFLIVEEGARVSRGSRGGLITLPGSTQGQVNPLL